MKQMTLLYLIILLAFTGGCGLSSGSEREKMNQESIPDTEAFKDEFTRGFMKSNKETEEGFYTFESRTEAYSMLFPVRAVISDIEYEVNGDSFEAFSIGEDKEEENYSYYIKVIFEDKKTTKNITGKLNVLSDMAGYTGEYRKEAGKEFDVYHASKEEMNYGKNVVTHLAYIKDKKTNKAISFNFNGGCTDEEKPCGLDSKNRNESFEKIVKSLIFK
ncbi:hypothetical protein [Metabacillus indicus]|uniref:hypothetical protein n=1 Tax=Metabacillus indicus TaxID=246786 RepID=UPI0004939724|nr:hypothetical protein [Metabacillus indicus]KEZ49287.1 hypothetical protein AZ46_0214605 [Metabacillus indicus LMG 22858]